MSAKSITKLTKITRHTVGNSLSIVIMSRSPGMVPKTTKSRKITVASIVNYIV